MIFQIKTPDPDLEFKVKDYYKHLNSNFPYGIKGLYCFYSNLNESLYAGKSTEIKTRISAHIRESTHTKEFAGEFFYVKIWLIKNQVDLDMLETFIINELKPKYNSSKVYNDSLDHLDDNTLYKNSFSWINESYINGLSESEMRVLSYLKEMLIKQLKEREYTFRQMFQETIRETKYSLESYYSDFIKEAEEYLKEELGKCLDICLQKQYSDLCIKFEERVKQLLFLEEKVFWVTNETNFVADDLNEIKRTMNFKLEKVYQDYAVLKGELEKYKRKRFRNVLSWFNKSK
ncbi:GIY-YIG nuclease family protein [Sutcliffiella horikoshii]|nr:GIY-YIG nuclease family protein [Sutcliffiella horikoshii]